MKLSLTLAHRYEIKEQLSEKAGRTTYLALDNQSHNLVVIKILQFNSLFQWDDLKLFEREAQTLKNLNHPNIPKYLDYFEVDEDYFQGFALVQTYIDAPSLEETIIKGRKFTEEELIELANKLLGILNYLHGQLPPVIHRDIKPSNILITSRSGNSIGDVYLVDFGSVQTVAKKDNGTITIVGTYGYIPLEQFSGKTTAVSDLYSLGMTLIYLVTGIHPAELPQIDGKVRFQFNSSNISNSFARWLEKMTYPYPDKRYQSTIAARNALKIEDNKILGNFLELNLKYTNLEIYCDRNTLIINYCQGLHRKDLKIKQWFNLVMLFSIPSIPLLGIIFNSAPLIFVLVGISFIAGICLDLEKRYMTTYKIVELKKDGNITEYKYNRKSNILDSKHKKIDYKKLNFTKTNSCSSKKINLLLYSPASTCDICLDTQGNLVRVKNMTIYSQLSIHAGYYRFFIKSDRLTDKELLWLGNELSDFLNLELQTMHVVPKIPSKTSSN